MNGVTQTRRPIVLVLTGYYEPGYRYGGPVRTISNMVDALRDEFDFRILTRDHDFGQAVPYAGAISNQWQDRGPVQVYYSSEMKLSFRSLISTIRSVPYDIMYLNSFFDPVFTVRPLLARRLGLIPKTPVVLATRGELAPQALGIRTWKKKPYLRIARALNLFGAITFQAGSPHEARDIVSAVNPHSASLEVCVAPDLVRLSRASTTESCPEGPLRICFMSRISRMKNLEGALSVLSGVQERVVFNIFGPIEDEGLWAECEEIITSLPGNVSVCYRGLIPPDMIQPMLSEHHLFFLPTRGESFGHAIFEALSAGTPVLISDRTPWDGVEQAGAGWVVPLHDLAGFRDVVRRIARLPSDQYANHRSRARAYAENWVSESGSVDTNRQLFRSVL